MSKGQNVVKWIKGQRISWLCHLERMEEERMPKKIFNQELEGTRRRGRSRKGWREEVERDLQVLGVRRWRDLVVITNKMQLGNEILLFLSLLQAEHVSSGMSLIIRSPNCICSLWFTYACGDRPYSSLSGNSDLTTGGHRMRM